MIPLDELDLVRHEPGLLAFAVEQLGTAATDADGFKELHAEAVAAVPIVQEHLRSATDELSEAVGIQTLLDPHSLDEDAIAFGASLPEGAAVVQEFTDLVAPPPPPPPMGGPPAPPPPPETPPRRPVNPIDDVFGCPTPSGRACGPPPLD